ncbi:hypothetical protein L211DRAFT_844817 [Terfezia boudieri ATCC MYA-4762]|uniref:Uncharacterized protein n=1 Tax=Terfezia boudieri ATCC MYA-4762 TaxID=1051890 RepID=A0A3N4M8G8_9PEZI|nr:hypothetical protein L211DRAFT_844817 [Terfezia boudieri ATCC MYA-4762]
MQLSSALFLVSAIVAPVFAQLFQNDPDATPRNMNISVDVTFPDDAPAATSQNAPVVIVNSIPKKVNVAVVNHEKKTIGIQFLGGSLWDLETNANVRNLTKQVLAVELLKGQKANLPYTILVDMHPKHLRLNLQMILRSSEQKLVTATAYNSTVSIVEQPMSLLDPQLLFLYLVLLSSIAGAGYWAYNYWLDTVNPKRKRGTRAASDKHVRADSPVGTATGVEGQKFDESWIPEHHIKRATSKGKATK